MEIINHERVGKGWNCSKVASRRSSIGNSRAPTRIGGSDELAGIDAVMSEAGATSLPTGRRVVLVGNKISPGNPVTKPDGTVMNTLWGELAWQLGQCIDTVHK